MPTMPAAPVVNFRLTLADREMAALFRECSGLDSETEVTEQRSVDESGQPVVRKLGGATRWSNITLKRGVHENRDLWEWREVVHREGPDAARTDGTIDLFDSVGTAVATYRFRQGWPVKYTVAKLSASTDEVSMEEIVICHEGFVRA
jgi:phage tail-like protein